MFKNITMRVLAVFIVLVSCLILVIWLKPSQRERGAGNDKAVSASSDVKSVSSSERSAQNSQSTQAPNDESPPEILYLDSAEESSLIGKLNTPETTLEDDLKLVKSVFMHYRTVFKENPIGSQKDIVSVLSGENPQEIEYLPKSHPALKAYKLYDRNGVPFYFHQISGAVMEIRSAGEDGVHWSQDDVVIR